MEEKIVQDADDKRDVRGLWIKAAVAAVCLLLVAVFHFSQDRVPPVIHTSKAVLPADGTYSQEGLLSGVTATDDRDGDISDEVYVKNYHINEDHTVAVVYAVTDHSGNLSTCDYVYIVE